jgi:hypothetical protein
MLSRMPATLSHIHTFPLKSGAPLMHDVASVEARGLAWDFVKQHWQAMARQYPESAYRRMYEGVPALVSPEWEQDARAFFADNKIDLGGRTVRQYLEQLRVAVAFQQREGAALAAYLSRQKPR